MCDTPPIPIWPADASREPANKTGTFVIRNARPASVCAVYMYCARAIDDSASWTEAGGAAVKLPLQRGDQATGAISVSGSAPTFGT